MPNLAQWVRQQLAEQAEPWLADPTERWTIESDDHLTVVRHLTHVLNCLKCYDELHGSNKGIEQSWHYIQPLLGRPYWTVAAQDITRADLATGESLLTLAELYRRAEGHWPAERLATLAAVVRERGLGPVMFDLASAVSWYARSPETNWQSVLLGGFGAALAVLPPVTDYEGATWQSYQDFVARRILTALDLCSRGGSLESLTYFCYNVLFILRWLDCLPPTAYPDIRQHSFWQGSVDYVLLMSAPDLIGCADFADAWSGPDTLLEVLPGIARLAPDGRLRWLLDEFYRRELVPIETSYRLGWLPDWFEPELEPGAPPAQPIFHSFVTGEVDVWTYRTGWEADDWFVTVKGGANANGTRHDHRDLGNLCVYRNDQAFLAELRGGRYSTEYFRGVPLPKSTLGHNCLVVDEQPQLPFGRARYLKASMTDGIYEVELELTDAYAGVEFYYRTIQGDARSIEVVDRLKLLRPASVRQYWYSRATVEYEPETGTVHLSDPDSSAQVSLQCAARFVALPDVEAHSFGNRLKGLARGYMPCHAFVFELVPHETSGMIELRTVLEIGV